MKKAVLDGDVSFKVIKFDPAKVKFLMNDQVYIDDNKIHKEMFILKNLKNFSSVYILIEIIII